MTVRILQGECAEVLATLPDESVHCCVTSPPYWGLRDYGVDGQLGLEKTPEEYVARMVEIFREVRRVLRADGTLWLNLGDSYASHGNGPQGDSGCGNSTERQGFERGIKTVVGNLKPKDLVGIPWRVAFALQADGWYLRSDIIWSKPNPMPESVTDRPTKSHEYVFMLAKSERYYFDQEAVAETSTGLDGSGNRQEFDAVGIIKGRETAPHGGLGRKWKNPGKRNPRTVRTIATQPYKGAHFAVMPPELAEWCIKAGCPEGGTVLDPFGGAGTTGLVADRLGRNAVLIELNPEYCEMARRRIVDDAPLFNQIGG